MTVYLIANVKVTADVDRPRGGQDGVEFGIRKANRPHGGGAPIVAWCARYPIALPRGPVLRGFLFGGSGAS
jgi:hypothetical protein